MAPFILGIIPARGGSKGIPRKNICLLRGKPLISYVADGALQSTALSEFVVSTEDNEIAQVAQQYGLPVLMRPVELAQDDTPTIKVVQHVVKEIEKQRGVSVDCIVIIQVTTPLLNAQDIDQTIKKLVQSGADSVVSVCKVDHIHPWKLKKIVNDRLVSYDDTVIEIEGTRRQDLPEVYIRNAGIYAVRRDVLMEQNSIYGNDCRPYIMPYERSINIDTMLDLLLAEVVLEKGLHLK